MSAIKHRRRLREKDCRKLMAEINQMLGCEINIGDKPVDVGELGEFQLLLNGSKVIGLIINSRPFPSLRILQEANPTKKFVEVDMGALKFIINGADVMKPGITACDEEIIAGDIVWIRDCQHKKPIAVGIAIEDGKHLLNKEKGKGVRTLHWVGDKIWEMW